MRPLLLLSIAAAATAGQSSSTTVPAAEREALVDLYEKCGGAHWAHQHHWLKGDPCQESWFGITCSSVAGQAHVTGIDINPVGTVNVLTGHIPPSLGNLSQLRKLYLSSGFVSSELKGEVPESLSRLQELRCFYMSHGDLTGPLPAWLNRMPNLQGIMMRRNKLSGDFPDLSALSDLRSLWFDEQNVSGTLESLAGLKRLHTVNGYNNKLHGKAAANGETRALPIVVWPVDECHNKTKELLREKVIKG